VSGVLVFLYDRDLVRKNVQPFFAGPRFNRRPPHACIDYSDRNTIPLMKLQGKEVPDNRKLQDIIPSRLYPLSTGKFSGGTDKHWIVGNNKLPDLRMISPIDIGAIAILVQFEVMHHVRLSGAEPYVTNENIFNGNLLLFALDYQVVRSSRGQRRQRHTPFPILSGCS